MDKQRADILHVIVLKEVTFRAEEVDLSSRRGRASSAQGRPGWGMERGSSSGGATPGSWNGERSTEKELTYLSPFRDMHAQRDPLI